MYRVRKLGLRFLRFLIGYLLYNRQSVFHVLEREFRFAKGRGTGGSSIEFEVKLVSEVLEYLDVRNPIVFDIGANIGLYSIEFLDKNPDATIFAFEPSSSSASELISRFESDSRVQVIQRAMGEYDGKATLWFDSPKSGLASLARRKLEHYQISFSFQEEVGVTTLDTWCEEMGITPDVVKMDIEGFELSALRGGTKTLERVKVVQFEFGGCNIDTRTFFQDFWYFFRDSDFKVFRMAGERLQLIEQYSELEEFFLTTNYLAINNRFRNR